MSGRTDNNVRQAINGCMIRDRYRLRGQLRRLKRNDQDGWDKLRKRIEQSTALAEKRQQAFLTSNTTRHCRWLIARQILKKPFWKIRW